MVGWFLFLIFFFFLKHAVDGYFISVRYTPILPSAGRGAKHTHTETHRHTETYKAPVFAGSGPQTAETEIKQEIH